MGGSVQPVARPNPPEEVVWVMAQQMRIKFISEGFREILCSSGVKEAVTEAAEAMQSKANENNIRGGNGYEVKMGRYGGGRWVAYVSASDGESNAAEAEEKALSRAVSG